MPLIPVSLHAWSTQLIQMWLSSVVVIIIGKFHVLTANHPEADIWTAFGAGKNFMYIHINTVCNALGRDKSMALPPMVLPPFHYITGCNTTSAFLGRGKMSAWEAWKAYYSEVTEAFLNIVSHPHNCGVSALSPIGTFHCYSL